MMVSIERIRPRPSNLTKLRPGCPLLFLDIRLAPERRREKRESNLTMSVTCDPSGLLVRLDQPSRGRRDRILPRSSVVRIGRAQNHRPFTWLTQRPNERYMSEGNACAVSPHAIIGKQVDPGRGCRQPVSGVVKLACSVQ
jgi:hypothetical protein